jgi:hypothetical protein
MGIKRYYAKKDNTITNAYMENLTTRGSGSNMGASDILEVFSIYGQASSSSAEKARAILKFDCTASTNSISTDRTAGTIPASGSVSFYLRMFNAPHGQTLPKNYTMDVSALKGPWTEGTGLDMEAYKDKGASNWVNAQGTIAKATLVDAIDVAGVAQNDKFTMTVPTSAGGDGVTYTFLFDSGTDVDADEDANTFGISLTSVTDDAECATVLVKAINGITNSKYKYGAANLGAGSSLTAGTIGLTAAVPAGETTKITLTMDDNGDKGNVANVLAAVTGFESALLLTTTFTGGSGPWASQGGDYFTDTSSSFSSSFDAGTEDMDLDITTLVEQWCSSSANSKTPTDMGLKEDNGLMVKLSSTYEGAARSYYTKKFFGKDTEFHFKQPYIEARWDSSVQDDRGNFYYSSSLATAEENLNTIYLYNYFRGRLRNIPGVGTGNIGVSFFSGSADDTAPGTEKIKLVGDTTHVRAANLYTTTGSYVSTGIYKASVALTAAATPISTLYDVWFKINNTKTSAYDAGTHYHTGSIKPKTINASVVAPNEEYVVSIKNLKNIYRSDETARFRVYTRQKDWSPTIYSKAVASAEVNIAESGSYEIYRISDDLKVIPYGTGSDNHTVMSYDLSGSYFDLDMNMLETGYMYGINFAFYNQDVDEWVQQPDSFKFRVESRQK